MLEDIGADEYKIEDNEKEYILKISSTDNKININLSTQDKQQFKNYSGEFTLDDLRRINRVFLLTQSIYEAKEEFKKAIERKKIAISQKDDYIHAVFYMMIGTDTSTLSIALPRDETPRIIRLEQNLNILKLGRDNLNDRLAVFEREAEEIKRDLDTVQMGNTSLHQIVDTIGQGIPDVSEILHDYKAGRKMQGYSSSFNKPPMAQQYQNNQNEDLPYSSSGNRQGDLPYSSSGNRQADLPYSSSGNRQEDLPYSSSGNRQGDLPYSSSGKRQGDLPYSSSGKRKGDLPYGSSGYKQLDSGYGNFGTIKESLNEQNRDSSMPNENNNNNGNYNIDENNIEENNPSVNDQEKFPNGILKDIIKDQTEIDKVTNKIAEKYPGSTYKLLYKGSRDGDGAAEFHSRCDDAEKTLVIVEDNYGNRFGGFTTQDWGGQYLQKKDDEAFIFSIDKDKVYDVIPDQNAIGCYPNFGPVFFGCQIRIYDNFLTKGGTTYKKGLNYCTTEDFELTNGNQNFGVRDIEVYEVESQE